MMVRFDERSIDDETDRMNTPDKASLVQAIQLAYPRLWFACHIEHRTRGQPHDSGLTDREGGILAHIADETDAGVTAAELADHLGIGKAALSQHLKHLRQLGMIDSQTADGDRRRKSIRLTEAGRRAVSANSPLDAGRLHRLLDAMSIEDAASAVRGLQRLAEAARQLQDGIDSADRAE
jgi:DNA-binding MarR family transcriptional regulator